MSRSKIKTIAGFIKETYPMEGHKLDGHEADIAELLKKGVTKGTIAHIFGVSRPDLYYFMQTRSINYKDKIDYREAEITEMFNSGCPLYEIAAHLHTTSAKISKKIKELGLFRSLSDVRYKNYTDKTIGERYKRIKDLFDKGFNAADIARTLGISYSTTYSYVAKFGTRKEKDFTSHRNDKNFCKQVKELLDKGTSVAEIARTLNAGCSTIYSVMAKSGLKVNKFSHYNPDSELVDKRDVIAKMHNIGISTKDIASVFECAPQSIRYRLNAVGIKMDTRGRTVTA